MQFAGDIQRYCSMDNTNSAIGERMHSTEVKAPAQNTQRCKSKFEIQTGNRYYENIHILKASHDLGIATVKQNGKEKEETFPFAIKSSHKQTTCC